MALIDKLNAIGDAIRRKTGTTELIPLSDMPQRIDEIRGDGVASGNDAFWDSYQNNGNREDYSHAFGGVGWNNKTFTPKCDIEPTSAYMIFRQCDFEGDLVEYLKSLGVKLDFSKATNTGYMFALASKITHIGVINALNTKSNTVFDCCFQNCSALHTIDKLIFDPGITAEFGTASFANCTALENITMDGEIYHGTGNNILNLKDSKKLSKKSILSIIEHLSEDEKITAPQTATLSREAVENAFNKSYAVGVSSAPDSLGFYKITLPDESFAAPRLEFTVPMDVTIYRGVIENGETIWDADAYGGENGVDSFELCKGADTEVYRYAIIRSDGEKPSEEEVVLIDNWDALVATKTKWTITLA